MLDAVMLEIVILGCSYSCGLKAVILSIVMLGVAMLNVITLGLIIQSTVALLSIVILCIVMLGVLAPKKAFFTKRKKIFKKF